MDRKPPKSIDKISKQTPSAQDKSPSSILKGSPSRIAMQRKTLTGRGSGVTITEPLKQSISLGSGSRSRRNTILLDPSMPSSMDISFKKPELEYSLDLGANQSRGSQWQNQPSTVPLALQIRARKMPMSTKSFQSTLEDIDIRQTSTAKRQSKESTFTKQKYLSPEEESLYNSTTNKRESDGEKYRFNTKNYSEFPLNSKGAAGNGPTVNAEGPNDNSEEPTDNSEVPAVNHEEHSLNPDLLVQGVDGLNPNQSKMSKSKPSKSKHKSKSRKRVKKKSGEGSEDGSGSISGSSYVSEHGNGTNGSVSESGESIPVGTIQYYNEVDGKYHDIHRIPHPKDGNKILVERQDQNLLTSADNNATKPNEKGAVISNASGRPPGDSKDIVELVSPHENQLLSSSSKILNDKMSENKIASTNGSETANKNGRINDVGQEDQRINNAGQGTERINNAGQGTERINNAGQEDGSINNEGQKNGRINNAGQEDGRTNSEGPEGGRINNADQENGRTDNEGPEGGRINNADQENGRTNNEEPEGGRVNNSGQENGRINNAGQENGRTNNEGPKGGRINNEGPEGGRTNNEGLEGGRINNAVQENGSINNVGKENASRNSKKEILVIVVDSKELKPNELSKASEVNKLEDDIVSEAAGIVVDSLKLGAFHPKDGADVRSGTGGGKLNYGHTTGGPAATANVGDLGQNPNITSETASGSAQVDMTRSDILNYPGVEDDNTRKYANQSTELLDGNRSLAQQREYQPLKSLHESTVEFSGVAGQPMLKTCAGNQPVTVHCTTDTGCEGNAFICDLPPIVANHQTCEASTIDLSFRVRVTNRCRCRHRNCSGQTEQGVPQDSKEEQKSKDHIVTLMEPSCDEASGSVSMWNENSSRTSAHPQIKAEGNNCATNLSSLDPDLMKIILNPELENQLQGPAREALEQYIAPLAKFLAEHLPGLDIHDDRTGRDNRKKSTRVVKASTAFTSLSSAATENVLEFVSEEILRYSTNGAQKPPDVEEHVLVKLGKFFSANNLPVILTQQLLDLNHQEADESTEGGEVNAEPGRTFENSTELANDSRGGNINSANNFAAALLEGNEETAAERNKRLNVRPWYFAILDGADMLQNEYWGDV